MNGSSGIFVAGDANRPRDEVRIERCRIEDQDYCGDGSSIEWDAHSEFVVITRSRIVPGAPVSPEHSKATCQPLTEFDW